MSSNRSWSRVAKRLSGMGWDELRVRARQEVAKRTDVVLSRMGARFIGNPDSSLPAYCGHFFFEPADVPRILERLRRRLPDVVDQIIHQAEQICRHRFDLLGYRDVDYGPQIDWHLDAVHGKTAPRQAWYRVPYLDFDRVGDAKITWELNRHQHLVTLAKAYRLTGHPHFARQIFEQWYDWKQQNPYPIGINWASSLEVAFRSLSWLWISRLLCGCPVVPGRFSSDLRQALMLNGRHIERYISTYFSPNTHLLGEGVGLFFIGTLCPGSTARLWQHQGWQIVLQQAQRQVRPDGMHFEHSTYYHTYALDFLLHARVLARLNGTPVPPAFDRTIEKMLEILCCLSQPGPLPRLGDDDGGRVFDPHRNRVEHMLDPLALGAVLFNRDDFKTAAGDITEETIWLLGAEAAGRFEDLRGDPPAPVSFALKPSGIHVMASSEPVAQQLVIDAGPSEPGREGHRHADALNVHLAINGHPVLIDPGALVYVGRNSERNLFRGTASHNTVHVDDVSQGEPDGPFEWRGLPRADVRRWVVGRPFDFFEGSHSGYRRLADPVEHRRCVFYLKPYFWLVRDVLAGADVHQVGVHWHFSQGSLRAVPGGATFLSDHQTALGLLFASNHPWSHDIGSHCYSPKYGKKESAPLLRCTAKAVLPIELVTLLIPISTTAAKLGVIEPFSAESKGASVNAYRYFSGTTEFLFVFATTPGNWQIGPWSSDARFLFCTPDRLGQPDCFVLCDGSYLALSGRRILVERKTLKYAEFFREGDRQRFSCSHADPVRTSPITEGKKLSRAGVLAAF